MSETKQNDAEIVSVTSQETSSTNSENRFLQKQDSHNTASYRLAKIALFISTITAVIYAGQLAANLWQTGLIKRQLDVQQRPWVTESLTLKSIDHPAPVDENGVVNNDPLRIIQLKIIAESHLQALGLVPATGINTFTSLIHQPSNFSISDRQLKAFCESKGNQVNQAIGGTLFSSESQQQNSEKIVGTLDGQELGAGTPNLRHGIAALTTPEPGVYIKILYCTSYVNPVSGITHYTGQVYQIPELHRGDFDNMEQRSYSLQLQPEYSGYVE